MVAPSGEGAIRCMRMALETVKTPIDYINPHATSTGIGDLKEIEAIREVFGAGENCPPIAATKSLTGHSLGATGAQEAIYSMLMMQNGFICESANIEELDPAFADMNIVRKRRDGVQLRAVLSNSFGFGGTNASIVLKHVDAEGDGAAGGGGVGSTRQARRHGHVANDHSIALVARRYPNTGRNRLQRRGRGGRHDRASARPVWRRRCLPCDVQDNESVASSLRPSKKNGGSISWSIASPIRTVPG